jgi:membrane protein implicated in regulation of membrane protease activity
MELMNHAWAIWTLIAIICAILEVTVPSFTFSFASLAAAAAAVASLRVGLLPQVGVFVLALALSVFLLRPRFLKKFQSHNKMPSRSEALVGLRGIMKADGRVEIEGHDWAARSDAKIEIGKTVIVQGHDGIVLIVKEI